VNWIPLGIILAAYAGLIAAAVIYCGNCGI